jgi:hypothetical protein
VVYAEILEYAKRVIPKFMKTFEAQWEIEQAELDRNPIINQQSESRL